MQWGHLVFLTTDVCPLRRGLHIPKRKATTYWILWGPAGPGSRLLDVGGLCFYEMPSSVVLGFPGDTTETYVSHIFYDLGLVVRGIEPAIMCMERRCLPKANQGEARRGSAYKIYGPKRFCPTVAEDVFSRTQMLLLRRTFRLCHAVSREIANN